MHPSQIPDKGLDRILGWFEKLATWARNLVVGRRQARWQRVVVSQPIANPDVFHGRGDDLTKLGDLFQTRNVIWLTGAPGIGKSALAGKFMRDKGLPDSASSFELGVDSRLQDLLESINSFLVDRHHVRLEGELKLPGLTPAQRIPALLRALAHTNFVLVIESYEEAVDDEDIAGLLLRAQEHLAGARMIVTTQRAPRWPIEDRRVHLGGLQPEESRGVLAELGVTEGWREIHDAVDGCPKGLRVAAGLAKTYGVDAAIRAAGSGGSPALGLFEEVYARVTEPARRMWVMLTMLPGPFHRETVLHLWGDDNGAGAWAQLADCSVLDPRGDRWQIHSLARATGGKERAGQRGWQKQYGKKLANYYADFAKAKAEDRAALEAELENLLAAARLAFQYQEWDALWGMGYALGEPLTYAGRWTAREELLRLSADGAAKAGNKRRRAAFTHNLGLALQQRGKLQEAEALYRESVDVRRELGNRQWEAQTLHQLGRVAQIRGNLEEAENLYHQSLEIEREVGDRPGEAKTLHELGTIAQTRGKLQEAEELYRESLGITQELGGRPGEARTRHALAMIAQRQGKWDEAAAECELCLQLYRDLGMRPEEAMALHMKGTLAQQRGKLEEAEDLYRQALEIEREVGDRPGEAATLHQLGMVAQQRGKLEEAEGLYRQSLEIAREVGDRPGEARTLHQLGNVAYLRGKLEEAENLYTQSLEIEREVGDRPGQATSYHTLALLAEQQGNLRLAVERMEEAHRMFEEMGLPQAEQAKAELDRLRKRLEEEG